jgi:hypothetical protein
MTVVHQQEVTAPKHYLLQAGTDGSSKLGESVFCGCIRGDKCLCVVEALGTFR